ncbi:hypothetical protein [Pimelobacter simplex]|uniref:hypothetical protein n=1 Tax=Nocardioides simplex TaxID=2045 RepID=UPI003AAA97FF
MPEPDPIAELLAQVAVEHGECWVTCECGLGPHPAFVGCDCGTGCPESEYETHLAEVQAAALRADGHLTDGAAEVEWGVRTGDNVYVHRTRADAEADCASSETIVRRQVIRTPWQPINHGQENP